MCNFTNNGRTNSIKYGDCNLEKKGILKKYKVELIGAKSKAISNAEDRDKI